MTSVSRSKEWLMHLLAEAAELEHNLLCSYLFAMFSLKESLVEGLNNKELAAIDRWRQSLLGVCVEEMTHLAQVANLTVAIGGRPHFDRPNIPVGAGYHPASVVIEFTPFNLDTLDHFVFLERPDGHPAPDGASFVPEVAYVRVPHHGTLMPSSPNYETIGAFYETLASGLRDYAAQFGESALFSGPKACQLRPEELHTDGLAVVSTLDEAIAAIASIVVEGEGSSADSESSHFAMFVKMRQEFVDLTSERPSFVASRSVGRNPVMHAPTAEGRTHVTEPAASTVLDAANAVYGLMLRCLARTFETPWERADIREQLLGGCIATMKVVSTLGRALTQMKATSASEETAGISFAVLRGAQGWLREGDALRAIHARASDIKAVLATLPLSEATRQQTADALSALEPVPN